MMHASNRNAIGGAVAFFKGNVVLSLSAIAILIAVALLRTVPAVGMIFAFAYPILSFAVQIYVGRQVPRITDPGDMESVARRSTLSDLFLRHLDLAAGGFLAIFLITTVAMLLFFYGLMSVGGPELQAIVQAHGIGPEFVAFLFTPAAMKVLLPFSVILLALSYFLPGVMGEVILAESFNEAFMRTFRLFSLRLWRRSLNRRYFLLVLVWSLIVGAAVMLMSLLTGSIFLLPVLLIVAYGLSLYNAILYVLAASTLSK